MEDRIAALRMPVQIVHAADDPFAAPHRRVAPSAAGGWVATIAAGVPLPDQCRTNSPPPC